MYELFVFTENLNPVLQGVLYAFVAFLAIFLFRWFYLWLTGVNLLLEELRELNVNIADIKKIGIKSHETQRRISVHSEVANNKLAEIQSNTEQLLFIWEE